MPPAGIVFTLLPRVLKRNSNEKEMNANPSATDESCFHFHRQFPCNVFISFGLFFCFLFFLSFRMATFIQQQVLTYKTELEAHLNHSIMHSHTNEKKNKQ